MKLKKVFEKFLQLEEELDLLNKKIDRVYFWELVRFDVCNEILESLGILGQAHTDTKWSFINKTSFALRCVFNFFFKNPLFAKRSDIVFLGHPRRKLLEDGKWWDIYCDPVIEQLLKDNYIYFEDSYLNRHLSPAKTKNLKYLDLIILIAGIKNRFRFTRVLLSKEEERLIELIEEQIEEYFSAKIKLRERVYRRLLERKSRLGLYKFLLRKTNPKIVVLVVSYGNEIFIEACKELKILVVELQHGAIDKYHFGYSFSGSKRKKRTFPDYFFTFSDFWKNSVEFPIEKNYIFSVGYPYLEKEAVKFSKALKKNQILFISQGSIGKELSKFAVRLSKYKNLGYNVVYKLHPGEYYRWKQEYPWLVNKRDKINIVEDDNIPLYKLMAESKVQVGVNSTAIYEGLNFGLDTYLLDDHCGIMDHLIKEGYAERIISTVDLVKKLKRGRLNKNIDIEKFFKKNSVDNILNVLNGLY